MLKAIGGWRARADVRYRLRAARARRGQTAKVYLLTSMLAMSLFGADAEFSQARPVERSNFIQFRDVVLLPLSGPSAASYQYAPNADDGGGLKVAITQITPSGAARITCDARLNGYPCGALNGWLKGSPQAWPGFSASAVIDSSAHKDVPRPRLLTPPHRPPSATRSRT